MWTRVVEELEGDVCTACRDCRWACQPGASRLSAIQGAQFGDTLGVGDDVDIIGDLVHRADQTGTLDETPHFGILDRREDRLGKALPVDNMVGTTAMVVPNLRID